MHKQESMWMDGYGDVKRENGALKKENGADLDLNSCLYVYEMVVCEFHYLCKNTAKLAKLSFNFHKEKNFFCCDRAKELKSDDH